MIDCVPFRKVCFYNIFLLLLGIGCLALKQLSFMRDLSNTHWFLLCELGIKLPLGISFMTLLYLMRNMVNSQVIVMFGTISLELYLIHWPRPSDLNAEWRDLDVETWKALEDLYKSKKIRAIGVSNFLPHHLNNLLERTSITPMVNQLEFHPGYIQKAAVDFCKQMGIQVEAWSPIGRARVLKEPLLMELAEKYQVSVAQICIRFALQCGVLPLPKSSSGERMHQNLDVFGFDIEENDMYQLMTLPQIGWSGEHPDRERVRF